MRLSDSICELHYIPAVKERASDIHIEPYEKETIYRFRINRVMNEILRQPIKTHSAVTARIKVMAKLDIAEKRLPQDGRIPIKMAGKDIDIRLSTVPVGSGERIVMRILEKNNTVLKLESLGFHGLTLKNSTNSQNKNTGSSMFQVQRDMVNRQRFSRCWIE